MIVFISDIHLTDGTSGQTIKAGAFRAFAERLRDLAYDASWRTGGKYAPIEQLDLVLLGDIFDIIRSTKWLDDQVAGKPVRPWDNFQSSEFIQMVEAIVDGIISNNAESLEILQQISRNITLPPATSDGKAAATRRDADHVERVPLKVAIHYMAGNHDWFLNIPDANYNNIRQMVVDAIGLANPADAPFPHDASESKTLPSVFRDHGVVARHGDIYDSFNFDGQRNASSLGDAIVVELIDRFPAFVSTQMGAKLPKECIDGLKEIDNVRPLAIVPLWIDGLLNRTCPPAMANTVKVLWDKMADDFLRLPFVQRHDSPTHWWDNVDQMETLLKISQYVSFHTIAKAVPKMGKWITDRSSFANNAVRESEYINGIARYVVYGHTHNQEIVPLDTSAGASPADRIYFNTGTWRQVHEMTMQSPDGQKFAAYHVMAYVAIYRGDERSGKPFETWAGTLGV